MENHELSGRPSNQDGRENSINAECFSEAAHNIEEPPAYEESEARVATIVRKRNLPIVDVAAERKAMHLTQKAFAKILGVSARTVESWEAGRSNPSPTARNLLYLLSIDHSLALKLQ